MKDDPNAIESPDICWEKTPTHKRCTKCGELQPVGAFHRKSESEDGRHTRCKDCSFVDRKKRLGIKVRIGDTMTCEVCGKEITRTGPRQKYCQSLCEPMPGLALECSCCGVLKGYGDFYDHRYNVDGKLSRVCKKCTSRRVLEGQRKKKANCS